MAAFFASSKNFGISALSFLSTISFSRSPRTFSIGLWASGGVTSRSFMHSHEVGVSTQSLIWPTWRLNSAASTFGSASSPWRPTGLVRPPTLARSTFGWAAASLSNSSGLDRAAAFSWAVSSRTFASGGVVGRFLGQAMIRACRFSP